MRETCKLHPSTKQDEVNATNLLVDNKHKVVFCIVNKVASSMVKRLFTDLVGGDHSITHSRQYMSKMGYKFLSSYPKPEKDNILSTYKKALLVRHPMDRLRSAYYNKFVASHYIKRRYAVVLKKYRSNSTDNYEHMHFEEFVKYIIDMDTRNRHWNAIHKVCKPCTVQYDYILRLETLERDLKLFSHDVLNTSYHDVRHNKVNVGRYPWR